MQHGRSTYELEYKPATDTYPHAGWTITEVRTLINTDIAEDDESAAAEWAMAYIQRDAQQGVTEMEWILDEDTGRLVAEPIFQPLGDD